jgi:endonuclease-3
MLSSQTKDQVNAAAIAQLKERLEGGLTAQAMAAAQPEVIHACINKVGFHNRKHVYVKFLSLTYLRARFSSHFHM